MTRTLQELYASGLVITRIVGTNALQVGDWLTWPEPGNAPDHPQNGLFVRKDMVTLAATWWPEAMIDRPRNEPIWSTSVG